VGQAAGWLADEPTFFRRSRFDRDAAAAAVHVNKSQNGAAWAAHNRAEPRNATAVLLKTSCVAAQNRLEPRNASTMSREAGLLALLH